MKSILIRVYDYFLNTSIIKVIFFAVLLSLLKDYIVNSIPFKESTVVDEIEMLKDNIIFFFFLVVILGPVIETILYQTLPINAVQQVLKWFRVELLSLPIFISAIIFSLSHWYNINYVVNAFLGGLIYAWFYVIVQRRKERAIIVVFLIHALKNLVVFIDDVLI